MPSRPTPLLSFPASTFLDPPPRQYSPPPPPSRLSRFVSILPLVLILLLQLLFTYTFLGTLVISHLLVDRSEFFRALGYSLVFVILAGGSIGCLLIAYLRGGGAIEVGRPEVMERRIDVEEEERDEDDVPLLNVYNQFRAEERSDRPASYQLKADGSSRRYCKKVSPSPSTSTSELTTPLAQCCIFKPDRSHHCSHCNRCIKKLDHYCPALGTCIGYANLKSFILFLLYTGIESTFVSVSSGIELNRFINEEGRYGNFEVAPIAWAVQMLFGMFFCSSLLECFAEIQSRCNCGAVVIILWILSCLPSISQSVSPPKSTPSTKSNRRNSQNNDRNDGTALPILLRQYESPADFNDRWTAFHTLRTKIARAEDFED